MLGKRIRRLREEKDLSQAELGKLLNISSASLSQYERGMRNPDYETLIKIANYFNVTTDYLLEHNTENTQIPLIIEDGNAIIQQALKDTGLLDTDGSLSDDGGKIIADFIRNNATMLKNLLLSTKKDKDDLILSTLKDTGLIEKNGELPEENERIVAQLIRGNADMLKNMLQLSKQDEK